MAKDKSQKTRRTRRASARRDTEPPPPATPPLIPPLVRWWLRNAFPGLAEIAGGGRPLPRFRRSQEHLRQAAIEVLEGMRACLDEILEWLREERGPAELKRIKVE